MFCLYSLKAQQTNTEVKFTKEALANDKVIKLNNNWAFYWGSFIAPNQFGNKEVTAHVNLTSWTNFTNRKGEQLPAFGYATYKTTFHIPRDRPNVSLYLPRIYGAYKIWINGDFILETGKISTSKATTTHRRFTKIIPLDSDKTRFEVVLQVANFYNKKGGITEPILLGSTEAMLYKNSLQIMVDMSVVGSFCFIGLLFLLFYLLYWNKDKAVLYFALLCVALSYQILNDRYAPLTKIFKDISWIILAKIEYIAAYIVGYCASLFFALILEKYVNDWYRKLVLFCSLLLTFLALVLPAPYYTELVLIFLVLMVFNIGFIIFTTIKAILAKNKASRILLVAIVFATFVFFANILFYWNENEIALIYVKFGYLVVFLFISMLLLRRFSNSFKALEEANRLAMVQQLEISEQSMELSNINLKLEENLKLLESNNEELEDFNHIVSHDLKTPLVSIYTLASFLEQDLREKLDANTAQQIKMIKDVVSKMEASINGLLAYAKVAKGSKQTERFLLSEVLEEITVLFKNQIQCTINLPKNDLVVTANKLELEHVFQNLISNAIKYNDKDKIIVDITAEDRNNEYLFKVNDNGPGVDPKFHESIFKIFNQLETNALDIESNGIGLAIVKKVINNNNGKITVSSKKGKGLSVAFTWQKPMD